MTTTRLLSAVFGGTLAALSAGSSWAAAISLDQWYTGFFGRSVPSLVSGDFSLFGTNAPLFGGGTAGSVTAPAGTSWTVTLGTSGLLTVTDMQISGDNFRVIVDGANATPATPWVGQPGLAGGLTSPSCLSCSSVGNDIGAALANADYASGTFALSAGVHTIEIEYLGNVNNGTVAFYAVASGVPEPATWAMMLIGFAGLGYAARRQQAEAAA